MKPPYLPKKEKIISDEEIDKLLNNKKYFLQEMIVILSFLFMASF